MFHYQNEPTLLFIPASCYKAYLQVEARAQSRIIVVLVLLICKIMCLLNQLLQWIADHSHFYRQGCACPAY